MKGPLVMPFVNRSTIDTIIPTGEICKAFLAVLLKILRMVTGDSTDCAKRRRSNSIRRFRLSKL
jgi:hypothetical protein